MIKQNILLGVGAGNWKVEVGNYGLYHDSKGTSIAQRPHNDFLWVFAEGGIIAFLSYILIFLILLKDAYSFCKDSNEKDKFLFSLFFAALIGYGLISMLGFPMERISHNIVFMLLFSIIVVQKIKKNVIKQYRFSNFYKITLLGLSCFAIYVSYNRYSREIHMRNAIHYKGIGNNDFVIKEINEAYDPDYYDIDNTSTPLLWYRGLAYFNLQRYDLAIQDFKQSYMVNPYHVYVINNLATCYGFNNEYDKAKALYEKCNSISPRFEEAALNLATIYSYEQRDEEALDILLGVMNFRIENKISSLSITSKDFIEGIKPVMPEEPDVAKVDSFAVANLSENYIQYFTTIFSELRGSINSNKKMCILASDRKKFYNQLKIIYWMRKKGNTYDSIIKNLVL